MSYPYYYPYYSARNVSAAPVHDLRHAIQQQSRLEEEQAEIELAVRLKQQQIAAQRIRQYEEELRLKQRNSQIGKELSYPNLQAQQRNIFQGQHHPSDYSFEEKRDIERYQSFGLDRENDKSSIRKNNLANVKNSEDVYNAMRVQQYQQQLLQKIQKMGNHQTMQKEQKECKKKREAQTKKQEKNRKDLEKRSLINHQQENVIINKKPKEDKNQRSFRYPLMEIKKGNIGQDQYNSARYQTIDVNRLKPKINKIFDHSDAKKNGIAVYQSQKKSRSTKKRCSSFVQPHTKKKSQDFFTVQRKGEKQEDNSLEAIALKKINNRLRLSSIVYQDSRWSHQRHHIDHLRNTYEIEEKGRKEIRDKINNHPKILKKHILVVDSR